MNLDPVDLFPIFRDPIFIDTRLLVWQLHRVIAYKKMMKAWSLLITFA